MSQLSTGTSTEVATAAAVPAQPAPADAGQPAAAPSLPTPRLTAQVLAGLAKHVAAAGERPLVHALTPLTGTSLGGLPECTTDDVAEAFTKARTAQREWAALSPRARAKVFLKLHDLVLARQDEGLDLIQLESGKARKHAFEEIADTAIVSRYYARSAESHLKAHRRKGALPLLTSTVELHQPRGVVAIIAPWNYPLSMAITDAIPALLAGNAVVLKPDSSTPYTALWAATLLAEAGLPEGVLQVLVGKGSVLGTAMIEHADYLCFTGSTATGRTVARQAGEHLIGCSLELGGKNGMAVLADADLDKAVDGAIRACFASGGQLCISIERLLVHADVYDTFVERFAERVRAMRLTNSLDFDGDMGSLVSAKQFATVKAHVDEAVAKGARVLAGGKARPELGPYFFEPTVLTDVTPDMTLCREETFGPVVSVYRFADEADALEKINDSEYGLNASVWSRDVKRARAFAAKVQAGTVNVNEAYAAAWASVDAPMGGMKASGLSRRHGREGILKYTEAQTVATQRFLPLDAPKGMSAKAYATVMTTALRVLRAIPGMR